MAYAKDKWVRRFLIPETTRHRKGFTIYKVTSVVYARNSHEEASKVSVWKRYNDFKKLHSELSSLYLRSQGKEPFPPFARPKFFGRFEVEVIEERRQCALQLLDFISKHASLYSSDAFIKFFETSHNNSHANDCVLSVSSDTSEDDRSSTISNSNLHQYAMPSIDKNSVPAVLEEETVVSSDYLDVPRVKHVPDKSTNLISPVVNNRSNKKSETSSVDSDASCGVIKARPVTERQSSVTLHDGTDLPFAQEDASYYIFIAAAHMSAAFRHEAIAEYEEAFTQYKMGISNLLNGVQSDPDSVRVLVIKEKISKYLERAERLYNRHLNCNVSMLSKPILELRYYKVLGVIKSVMLVKDVRNDCLRIVKTIERPADAADSISNYILRGQIPYLVKLHACVETKTAIYLVLQYANRGKLWDYVKSRYGLRAKSHSAKEHSHSFNCIPDSKNVNGQGPTSKIVDYMGETRIDLKCGNDTNTRLEEVNKRKHGSRDDTDLSTAQLLEKAQKLLQSVNATLKKSNSVANRLNEHSHLVCQCDNSNCSNVVGGENEDCRKSEERRSDSHKCLTNNNSIDLVFSGNRSSRLESRSIGSCKEKHEGSDSLASKENRFGWEEELWRIPEGTVRLWAAEILLALEALHQQEVVVADLRPDNVLLDDDGHVKLTYIVPRCSPEFLKFKQPYSAPELCTFSPVILTTASADIWSFGVILYELLTGSEFQSRHSGSFHSHSMVNLPKRLSTSAKSLLNGVLKYRTSERLTIPEIKKHPFFDDLRWSRLLNPQT